MDKPSPVLIIGAASGIGRATALLFARNGFFVYCHVRNASADGSVLDDIHVQGGEGKLVFADLLHEHETRAMFQSIPSLQTIVFSAGTVTRTKPVTSEDFRKTLEINLIAPFLCASLAREKGAIAIVFVGSMRGLSHMATTPDYSASKAALHNLTVSLAREYAPHCRVNAVAPGFTRTKMHEGMEDRLQREMEKTPLKMIAEPEDIAESVFFLSSQRSRFITGQVLVVDGGRIFFGAS